MNEHFIRESKKYWKSENAYQKKLRAKKKERKKQAKQKPKYKYDLTKRKIEYWKSYADYCRSEAFYIWKMAILTRYKYKCQMCKKKAETAHHLKYKSWGTETINDGIALCNKCHRRYHYNEPWWARE